MAIAPDVTAALQQADLAPESRTVPVARMERLAYLFEEHAGFVARTLRRLGISDNDVEDGLQEVFLIAQSKLDQIEPGKERSFLFGTAYKVAQATRRDFVRSRPSDGEDADATPDTAPTPEEQLDGKQTQALALRLLDELEEGQRQVFVLYEIEGLTMQRISELTGLPMGTVASRLRRGREAFLARFERHRNSLRGAK